MTESQEELMARMPRLVVPGYSHHITQRGVRRMKTFFSADDYQYYLDLVSHYKDESGVSVWACCLMPNHVHFVAVPKEKDGLSNLFRQVHFGNGAGAANVSSQITLLPLLAK